MYICMVISVDFKSFHFVLFICLAWKVNQQYPVYFVNTIAFSFTVSESVYPTLSLC
jgi:hypothetical protein